MNEAKDYEVATLLFLAMVLAQADAGTPFVPVVLDVHHGEVFLSEADGGFDPTPTVFVPWEGGVVKPGFQGELGLIARYTDPDTGAEIEARSSITRVRPWA